MNTLMNRLKKLEKLQAETASQFSTHPPEYWQQKLRNLNEQRTARLLKDVGRLVAYLQDPTTCYGGISLATQNVIHQLVLIEDDINGQGGVIAMGQQHLLPTILEAKNILIGALDAAGQDWQPMFEKHYQEHGEAREARKEELRASHQRAHYITPV